MPKFEMPDSDERPVFPLPKKADHAEIFPDELLAWVKESEKESADASEEDELHKVKAATFAEFVLAVEKMIKLNETHHNFAHASRVWGACDNVKQLLKAVKVFMPVEEDRDVINYNDEVQTEVFRQVHILWHVLINMQDDVRDLVMKALSEKLEGHEAPKWP